MNKYSIRFFHGVTKTWDKRGTRVEADNPKEAIELAKIKKGIQNEPLLLYRWKYCK